MCGRFSIHLLDLSELREPFALDAIHIDDWSPRYNVAPTQLAPVITLRPERTLERMRWGLVPRWATDTRGGAKTINARIETAARLPSFRDAMARRRCIVPVTGFYEWRRVRGKRAKQPLWIHPRAGTVLALAGLWETWTGPDAAPLDSFAIVTRDASGFVREIHDRMPVVLDARWMAAWLDPDAKPAHLARALASVAADVTALEATAVGTSVNAPAHDAPDCIAPAAPGPVRGQLDLFGDANL
jgi:putative SOS response-associated peptidase YedK